MLPSQSADQIRKRICISPGPKPSRASTAYQEPGYSYLDSSRPTQPVVSPAAIAPLNMVWNGLSSRYLNDVIGMRDVMETSQSELASSRISQHMGPHVTQDK